MATTLKISSRRKALTAAIFAGAIISAPSAAWSQDIAGPTAGGSLVEQIANDSTISCEVRAYQLLQLGDQYLSNKTPEAAELHFNEDGTRVITWRLISYRTNDRTIHWAQRLSTNHTLPANLSDKAQKIGLANAAVRQGVKLLKKSSDNFQKLHLYYIASILFEKIGNSEEAEKCNNVVERAINSCEHTSPADERQVMAVTSVLDLQAYRLLPVDIPVQKSPQGEVVADSKPFTKQQFKSAEHLRLKAIAIADKLDAQTDTRRRLHRDMYFWYSLLGKTDLANTQKQHLFELLARHDERILYPYPGICGNVIWWNDPHEDFSHTRCGMG